MKKKALATAGLIAVLAVFVLIGATGCGKKGPPLAPIVKGDQIAAVSDLQFKTVENGLTLTWKHKIDEEDAKVEPDGFNLFMAKKTFEDCEGCPFKFDLLTYVPMPATTYSFSIEQGFRYYFRVRAVNDAGKESEYSKTVQYEYK